MYKKLDIENIKKLVSKNCVICDVWNVFETNKIIFTVRSLHSRSPKDENTGLGGIFETKWRDI